MPATDRTRAMVAGSAFDRCERFPQTRWWLLDGVMARVAERDEVPRIVRPIRPRLDVMDGQPLGRATVLAPPAVSADDLPAGSATPGAPGRGQPDAAPPG